ncbi:YbjN domain-containing protein [uncultured Deinococcus sp.]|uniref:YbjN domain-containing protein n=1 Tax=uncultured Deinococcus sp. TaxID=158789 RepID=UPI0025D9EB53|nr:YbjN domain-containing protein [uncultured Deinococcus sp.]
MRFHLLQVMALTLLSSGVAATGEVLDGKPETVVQVLKQAGYATTYRPGDLKDGPTITLKVNGEDVYLYLYGCKPEGCTRLTASNGYETDVTSAAVLSYIGNWNYDNYTQAYIDPEDKAAYLDSSYLLTGGYTRANLVAWLREYLDDLPDFETDLP